VPPTNLSAGPTAATTIPPPVASRVQARDQEDEIDLGALWIALSRRRRLALAVAATVLALGATATIVRRIVSPVYQGSFQLLVTDPISQDDRRSTASADPDSLRELAIRKTGAVDTAVLIQVLRSTLLLEPVARRFDLPVEVIGSKLTVADADRKAQGVLNVTLQWENPAQGEALLQALAERYLDYSLRQRQEKLRQGLAFLDEQAPELQKRMARVEQELASFRRSSGFLEPATSAAALQERRQQLLSRQQELAQRRAQLSNLAASVQAGRLLGQQFQAQELVTEVYPKLREDLTQVEKELADADATFTAEAPQVRSLRARRDELRGLLQRRELDVLATQLSDNRAQQAEVERQLSSLARQFSGNPALVKQYDAIQQRLTVARDNLSSYIKSRESFRLEVAQRTVPWQVIVPPKFLPSPVKPSLSRNLALWTLLAAGAGLGAALLRERLDHVFHSARELEAELGLPLLGLIPHLAIESNQTIAAAIEALEPKERFTLRESLRNLFTSFRLLRADKPLRLILFTSSAQAEGKTTATALFAQTLSDLGQRVLVVDADLRRPRLHQKLGIENLAGFSTLLTAEERPDRAALEGMIQRPGERLHLLTAGPTPPDAAKLLSAERCGHLCDLIRALPEYDVVLFDSPPALDLSDPVLLSEHLDGLLFLVGIAQIDRALPAMALRRISGSGVDVLGVVANQVVASSRYGNGYGYGYGYSYSYSDGAGRYRGLSSRYLASADPEAGADADDQPPSSTGSAEKSPRSLRPRVRRLLRWLDRGA
jgi:succinoglycan biosynthesis transport protein ExoP